MSTPLLLELFAGFLAAGIALWFVLLSRSAKQQEVVVRDPAFSLGGAADRSAALRRLASAYFLPEGPLANAALLLASAGLATAYAKQGIRVTAVSPGPTLTERLNTGITNDARVANISKETAIARMVERIPMGRIASPEEVADAVVFLASSRASYITGVNIMMDGSLVPLI
jgi:hypothetical protein